MRIIDLTHEREHREIERWAAQRTLDRFETAFSAGDFGRIQADRESQHEELETRGVPWAGRQVSEHLDLDELLEKWRDKLEPPVSREIPL